MGRCGIEKPMQEIYGIPTVRRVADAIRSSDYIDEIHVSVSSNTPETEKYLQSIGIDTILTSGESFMDDLHTSFEQINSEYILTCPSDLPLLSTDAINSFIEFFEPGTMQSAIAVVDEETVRSAGITPSYTREDGGKNWVLSGICIMNREKTLNGEYLEEVLYKTNRLDLSVNVNTRSELSLARILFGKEGKKFQVRFFLPEIPEADRLIMPGSGSARLKI